MQASRAVAEVAGVQAALLAMGTELNLTLLASMGFPTPDGAGPDDLLIAISGDDDAVSRGRDRVEELLTAGPQHAAADTRDEPPRTTAAAARRAAGATLALVSVPGRFAGAEAMDALDTGLDVMIFSDNVPVAVEVAIKKVAAKRGRLVMGPDCGTAVVGGVGLGFANSLRPGPVSLVAASGTGAQQLTCLLDAADVGTRHVLGVGGRDLSTAVAGRSTLQALTLLDADPDTELIVVLSKPPAPEVAARVEAAARAMRTPVVLALLGEGRPDLTAVAEKVVRRVGGTWHEPRSWPALGSEESRAIGRDSSDPTQGRLLRGLFGGGTLCDEAMVLAAEALGPIESNVPLRPDWALPADLAASGHAMIDFGEDRLTQGRAHPMIDQRSRLDRLGVEAADPAFTVVLLDVVLGYGAHPDPAAELAPAISAARRTAADAGRDLAVVVSLVGTSRDSQGLQRQAEALASAGASVHLSNAAAAREAVERTNRAAGE
jgi:FdrA protein